MDALADAAPLRVLVVDDHAIVREGVAQLVQRVRPGASVSLAGGLADAERLLAAQPDCSLIVLDLHLPGLHHPLDALRRLRARLPLVAVLVVSADEDAGLAQQALREGAAGFVAKSARTEVLASALQLVLDGEGYFPPSVMRADAAAGGPLAGLTPRQREVLRELVAGKPNKDIARSLGLSEPTVKAHLVQIFRMLGVRNRAQAALAGSRLLG